MNNYIHLNLQISKPNLWYYERMTFLLDHIIPKERKNSSEQTSSISHADDLLLSTDTTQYPQEPKDFLQSSNEGMLLNDEVGYILTYYCNKP